ncbi:MAG: hypothetical protein HYT16_01380 [DPANN group archaeon]|nr:hypothetical protein [DPANN group archaeon]
MKKFLLATVVIFLLTNLAAPAHAAHKASLDISDAGLNNGQLQTHLYYDTNGNAHILVGDKIVFAYSDTDGNDGLTLTNGGVTIYHVTGNKDEVVAVQCNKDWFESGNPNAACQNFYDCLANSECRFYWDEYYYAGNNIGNKQVPLGEYYGRMDYVDYQKYTDNPNIFTTGSLFIDADDDGDKVPNGADGCPKTAGTALAGNSQGCPSTCDINFKHNHLLDKICEKEQKWMNKPQSRNTVNAIYFGEIIGIFYI